MPPAASLMSLDSDGPTFPVGSRKDMLRDFRPFPISRPAKQDSMDDSDDRILQSRKTYASPTVRRPTNTKQVVRPKISSSGPPKQEHIQSASDKLENDPKRKSTNSATRQDVEPRRRASGKDGKQRVRNSDFRTLNSSYPLTRKDAKKRNKEGRFRIKIEKPGSNMVKGRRNAADSVRSSTLDSVERMSSLKSSLSEEFKRSHRSASQDLSQKENAFPHTTHGRSSKERSRRNRSKSRRARSFDNGWTLMIDRFYCSPADVVGDCVEDLQVLPPIDEDLSINASYSDEAMNDLLRVTDEMEQLRRMTTMDGQDDHSTMYEEEKDCESGSYTRKVRFAAPLVTKIKHRPYTEPEEIAALYYIPDELEDYEHDRETTNGDQFECSIAQAVDIMRHTKAAFPVDLKAEDLVVTVAYRRRAHVHLPAAPALMLSPSDLSALEE